MRIEPSGDIRNLTATVRQIYLGFVESGFTETEAMDLTRTWLGGLVGQNKPS